MLRRLFLHTMLVAAAILVNTSSAHAQVEQADPVDVARHPVQLFEKCVESVRHLVSRCDNRTKETVQECVPRIKRLLNAGKREEAKRLARKCTTKIERQSNQCVDLVKQRCERCINALLDMGAPRLAHRLREICADSIEHLRTSERRAIRIIRQLFD